ncbi:MAG: FprA family A-type flavoprotein [Candidatus Aminicenantes bacterium]|nr:FprA family A-type flavoprotein [Candidatus Aminicenantes bacterium]MCK4758702.1 FprA family A-type flavoprotein [Candidatus Aminicenantes bacterium]
MPAIKIKPDVYWIGVNDRTTDLFEGIWPISKEGVSYNSYLIDDEKKAVIDLTKSFKGDEYLEQINELTDVSQVDYVVINHMEPDHSGLLRTFRRIAPRATFIGSAKTKEMLESFFSITDNVQVVSDGDTLSLGKRTLKFFSTPFLHWPETIMTYEVSDRILFPCDAFGGYGAIRGAIFDDQCEDFDFYKKEALRYYVNIVANYSARVLGAIEKLADLPVDIIAPSHGLIWRKNPSLIVDLYKKWAECAAGKTELGITLVYGSMYGYTELMMNAVAQGISQAGVPVEIFDASRTHVSYILPSLWTKKGVMIGAPTYEVSLFPPVAEVLNASAHKHIKNKKAAYFGSFGWSGGALRNLEKIIEPLKWDLVDTFEFKGCPKEEEFKKGEEFGRKFAELVKK